MSKYKYFLEYFVTYAEDAIMMKKIYFRPKCLQNERKKQERVHSPLPEIMSCPPPSKKNAKCSGKFSRSSSFDFYLVSLLKEWRHIFSGTSGCSYWNSSLLCTFLYKPLSIVVTIKIFWLEFETLVIYSTEFVCISTVWSSGIIWRTLPWVFSVCFRSEVSLNQRQGLIQL